MMNEGKKDGRNETAIFLASNQPLILTLGATAHEQAVSYLKSSYYLSCLVFWGLYFKHSNPKRNQRFTFEMFSEVSQSGWQ